MKTSASIITIYGILENKGKYTTQEGKQVEETPPHLVVRNKKEDRKDKCFVFVNRVTSLTRPRIHWFLGKQVEETISIGLSFKMFG